MYIRRLLDIRVTFLSVLFLFDETFAYISSQISFFNFDFCDHFIQITRPICKWCFIFICHFLLYSTTIHYISNDICSYQYKVKIYQIWLIVAFKLWLICSYTDVLMINSNVLTLKKSKHILESIHWFEIKNNTFITCLSKNENLFHIFS